MNDLANPIAAPCYPCSWSLPAIGDVDELVTYVDRQADELLAHPAAVRMRAGDVSPRALARIHANIAFQSFHGPTTFALAGARVAASHPALDDWLIAHAGEETGHWRWAMADLADVAGASAPAELQPQPEALAYAGWNYFLAQVCPLARIGAAALLERLSTRCEEIVNGLAASVPAPQRATTFRFARSHATTDLRHWAEIQQVLRDAALSPDELGLIAWAASATRDLYAALFAAPLGPTA